MTSHHETLAAIGNRCRHGGGFLKFIVVIVLLAVVIAVGFTAFSNWRHDGKVTVHVADPAWWSVGGQDAKPLIDEAKATADLAYRKLWDDGGWVDQADKWLESQKAAKGQPQAPDVAPAPAPDAPPAAPATPIPAPDAGHPPAAAPKPPAAPPAAPRPVSTKSAAARQAEEKIATAEQKFQEGVDFYKQGNPANGGWSDAKKNSIAQAKSRFGQVRDTLSQVLDDYEKLPDHNDITAKNARELQHINQRLLFNADKMSGGL